LDDLLELSKHGLVDAANIQVIWGYFLSENRNDYLNNTSRRLPGLSSTRVQSMRIDNFSNSSPEIFARANSARQQQTSPRGQGPEKDFVVVTPNADDLSKMLPGVPTCLIIKLVHPEIPRSISELTSTLTARGTSKPGGPFDIQIKLINAGIFGAYFTPPDYGHYAIAITQKGQHVIGSPVAFAVMNKGRGVLPITTLVNLPAVSLPYNQILLNTSSIIFDDGQFDPNIASHDISVRITGPIPTQASIVKFLPDDGSFQFTFTPIMQGDYFVSITVDGSPIFMDSPKIVVAAK